MLIVWTCGLIYNTSSSSSVVSKAYCDGLTLFIRFCFSNLGIALLGQVLARRFNGDGGFEDYMKRILLDPLGLKNTIFTLTDR